MSRTLRAGGVRPGDVVQNAYGYGLFTGGLGFHYGAEAVGAAVIPVSGGFTERQLVAFQDLGSTVLCCTPSYALHLAEAIEEAGVAMDTLRLRVGFFGAEPWTEAMRTAIEERLRLMALNIYGLSEITGPGVAVECAERRGCTSPRTTSFQVVDPEQLEPVPPGTTGSSRPSRRSAREGMPLLRYRTRDLTTLDPAPCRCGRTLVRLGRIMARSDDMLIIRGVNVYPSQVEHALLQVPELAPHYVLVVRREHALDTLEVQVESQPGAVPAGEAAVGALAARVRRRLAEALGVSVEVGIVAPKTIERSVGKAKRVLDLRGQSG
jgi:phenylacetate-CoA ligase